MVKGYGAIKEKNAKLYHCPANGCDNKDNISKHLKSYNEHKTKRENVPNNKVCPTCSKNFVMQFQYSAGNNSGVDPENLCDVFRDLVSFKQIKKREKHPRRGVTFSKVAGF